MSGAAGHLMHLHENRALTFGELKDVLRSAADGRLEQATEKFDGMNLVFTWDFNVQDIKVARSGNDIDKGGLTSSELSQRFAGRGSVQIAFNQAFEVLRQAIGSLSPREVENVFQGSKGRYFWYSIEVVYPSGSNTLNYDTNCVIFHGHPVFETGLRTKQTNDSHGIELLTKKINLMQTAVQIRGWKVMGPVIVKMQNVSNGQALTSALSRIDDAMLMANVNDACTIGDYLYSLSVDRCLAMGINQHVATQIGRRLTNEPGAPNITKLTKMAPGHASRIIDLVKNDKKLLAEFMQPIEQAINILACDVLRGLSSVLVKDSTKEIQRLRDEVDVAIQQIQRSGDIQAIDSLSRQLNKFRGTDDISSTVEGIVFIYKGQAYKMTGAWAPAHQILSLYQRTYVSKKEEF
jgi:hypothetical protein